MTIVATPVPGTRATAMQPITCVLALSLSTSSDSTISGVFARGSCTGLPNRVADIDGTVTGTRDPGGRARLVFDPAPLPVPVAVTTSGGCPPDERASGPYEGRLADGDLDLQSSFRLHCAGLPSPAPPAFDVEYRITAGPR